MRLELLLVVALLSELNEVCTGICNYLRTYKSLHIYIYIYMTGIEMKASKVPVMTVPAVEKLAVLLFFRLCFVPLFDNSGCWVNTGA